MYKINHEKYPDGSLRHVVTFNGEFVGDTAIGAVTWRIIAAHRAKRRSVLDKELHEAWRDSGTSVPFDQWVQDHAGVYAKACQEYLRLMR